MAAHAAPGGTRSAVRLATTGLAVAVTGLLGGGTALAHDGGWDHHGHSGHSGSSGHSGHDDSSSSMADSIRAEAQEAGDDARSDARERVADVLADLGLPASDSGTGGSDEYADVDAEQAGPAVQPAASERPATSTQPIAAGSGVDATEVPPAGETQVIPIR
ncbi:hypothetical protein WCD74_16860 [Actinomycetospora sp. OC33-EN08]|uniref:Uncharacterized protein n=1 Tax=Actinomycetospora aurantiaca TaxID=3129233 RepID=A0ABU8MQ53_9PSEU